MNWPWTKKKTEQEPLTIGTEIEGRIDRMSPTWICVENWARFELLAARERNDKASLDVIKTSAIRGRIGLLKEILALPDKDKEPGNRLKRKQPPVGILAAGAEEDDE